jgi:hypothetical protein
MNTHFMGIPIYPSRYYWLRTIVLASLVSSLVALGNGSYSLFCLLAIIQNIVYPFAAAMFLMNKNELSTKTYISRNGALLGGALGMIGAISHGAADSLHFYVFGGREAFLGNSETIAPPLSAEIIVVGVTFSIFVWLVLVVISAFAGLVGSRFDSRPQ